MKKEAGEAWRKFAAARKSAVMHKSAAKKADLDKRKAEVEAEATEAAANSFTIP